MDDLRRYIENERPNHVRYTAKLSQLLRELLADAGIEIAQLDSRTKSVESLVEKANREGKSYDDPLREITDFTGVRIITYFREDVSRVAEIIRREFVVDGQNSRDMNDLLDPDQLGYQSVHFVVNLRSNRSILTEWSSFQGFAAEIQVRTVVQHAWAAISHKLDYKSQSEVPKSVRRKLFRLSALLELADDEFASFRNDLIVQRSRYESDIQDGNTLIDINLDSVSVYVSRSTTVAKVLESAREAGIRCYTSNESESAVGALVSTLRIADFLVLKDFDDFLSDQLNNGLDEIVPIFIDVPARPTVATFLRLLVTLSLPYETGRSCLNRMQFKKALQNRVNQHYAGLAKYR